MVHWSVITGPWGSSTASLTAKDKGINASPALHYGTWKFDYFTYNAEFMGYIMLISILQ